MLWNKGKVEKLKGEGNAVMGWVTASRMVGTGLIEASLGRR